MDLCSRFSVDHYPFLLWGPPAKFASAQWKLKQENNEIELIDGGKTAESLLKWINKKMGRQVLILAATALTKISLDIELVAICTFCRPVYTFMFATCVHFEVCWWVGFGPILLHDLNVYNFFM
jgi:hypothetical protein